MATHAHFDANTEALEVAKAFPQSIQGKTIIVTGVNKDGIGFTTAQAFASQSPAHLIIASRNLARIQICIDELKKDYPDVDYRALKLDLGNQKAVRDAANEVLGWEDIPAINIIVNSAGIMLLPERQFSPEGIELTFATNHIGHYLFTCLIMSKLLKAAEASPKGATRIINVSSGSPCIAGPRWSDPNFEKINKTLPKEEQPNYGMMKTWSYDGAEDLSYIGLEAYNQSKVANVLFSIGLNKRLSEKGILSFGVHPGVIMTELGRYASDEVKGALKDIIGSVTLKTLGAGSSTSLVTATDPGLKLPADKDGKENLGSFWIDCQVSDKADPRAESSANAERMWKRSEELVGEKFAW